MQNDGNGCYKINFVENLGDEDSIWMRKFQFTKKENGFVTFEVTKVNTK